MIGAGKFGSMYLAQAVAHPGTHVWPSEYHRNARRTRCAASAGLTSNSRPIRLRMPPRPAVRSLREDSGHALVAADGLDVVIDATGIPRWAIRHALLAAEYGRHIVMVNVEADVLAGPL